ncbi:hypothetical protein NA56DRAFT_709392 [Hyaloscypha hepaticicola]|uniref:Uncharacterized protein n=1 Tax=Hyaloscypha hepaticicola TaxID=2082293 RepID=A0A2J6PPT4_9HELO|nr:hypothetical protein NA56DRAFT_709392 [Hyaloscypha hepaticicola]
MSSATAECERCRDGDLNNHWDHRTKVTFQTIYDRVKFLLENKPREWKKDPQAAKKELQGAMRELLAKHIERAIGRQIVKTKAIFDGSNLFPQKDDPDAPNHFRWAFNGNYTGFPANKLSLWSEPHILECFEALESDELYIEDLEKALDLDEPKFQLARAAADAFRKHIWEHTGRPVKDLQKCLVGDGSAGLRGWKWDFSWQEEFHKFPHQRLLWKWSDKDLKASMELLKNGSLKLVRIESLRSSSSASCEKTVKKETKATKAARRRGNTMVPSTDDKDDEENEPHNDDKHDDDFDSGSTVVVDEGSNSGDFESYLHMTYQLLKYPARLEKLQPKVLELQTLNNTLRNSNKDLGIKIEDTKKQLKSARARNEILLETLEKKELEVKEMKTKCDRLERENEELSRKYAASEQKLEVKEMKTKCDRLERENEELNRKYAASEQKVKEATTEVYNAINRTTTVSESCDALAAELEQQNKSNRALITGMLASIERSHSPVLETITRPTEPPGQAGHQESPLKTHARPSNIRAASKISQNLHLGYAARTRPFQPSLGQQSPTRPTRPALIPKPNNAHVLTFNCHLPSSNGREGTGTSAKNTPTAQGSENIAQGDTEWLQTESPDCKIFRTRLADDQGGQMFSFKREWSDDERPQTTSKKARN